MAKFSATTNSFASPITTPDTAISVHANAAGESFELVEAIMTGSGTSTANDFPHTASLQGSTLNTAGTGTAFTADVLRGGAQASLMSVLINYTAEPAANSGNERVQFGFNQRGGMRYAVPQGEGINIHNADTVKALLFFVQAQTAGAVDATVHYWEP